MRVVFRQVPGDLADYADDDHQDHRSGEQVRGDREGLSRLLDPAQVAVAHDQDDADGDLKAELAERGECGHHRGGACGGLDGDSDDVVDEQRHRGDLGDLGPEVLPGHDVGTAGPDVDHHHFAVGQHHECHHDKDDEGHRQDDV